MERDVWPRIVGLGFAALVVITTTRVANMHGDADQMPQPALRAAPAIDTDECLVEAFTVRPPIAAQVDEVVTLDIEPSGGASGRSCPADVHVYAYPPDAFVFPGGDTHRVDFATSSLQLQGVPLVSGEIRVFVSVTSTNPCVRRCQSPFATSNAMAVEPNAKAVAAYESLDNALSTLTISQSGEKITRGVAGELVLTVSLDVSQLPADLSRVVLTLSPADTEQTDSVQTIDLVSNVKEYPTKIVAKPPDDGDWSVLFRAALTLDSDGEAISSQVVRIVPLKAERAPWWNSLDSWSKFLVSVTGGAAAATGPLIWYWKRRTQRKAAGRAAIEGADARAKAAAEAATTAAIEAKEDAARYR